MKSKILRNLMAMTIALTTLAGSALPVAAEEITGTDGSQSKDIEVTATVSSVYQVTLPAIIDLTYRNQLTIPDDDSIHTVNASGYFANVKAGVSGLLLDDDYFHLKVQYPITMTEKETGETFDIGYASYFGENVMVLKEANAVYGSDGCIWAHDEVGSCDYDGTSLSNCQYSYWGGNNGVYFGTQSSDIPAGGEYSGTMTFKFGISDYTGNDI